MAQLSIFRFRPTGEPLALKFECDKDNPQDNRIFLDIIQAAQNNRLSVVTGVQRVYVVDKEYEDPLFEMECSDTEAQQIYECLKTMYGTTVKAKGFQESGIVYIPISQTMLTFMIGDDGKPCEVLVDKKARVHFDEVLVKGEKFPLVIVEAPEKTHLWSVLRSAIDTKNPLNSMMVAHKDIVISLWFCFFGEWLYMSAVSNHYVVSKLAEILNGTHKGTGKYVYSLYGTENNSRSLAFFNHELCKGELEKRNYEVLNIHLI